MLSVKWRLILKKWIYMNKKNTTKQRKEHALYALPEGYMDSLTDRLVKHVDSNTRSRSYIPLWLTGMAASIALVWLFFSWNTRESDELLLASVDDETIEWYASLYEMEEDPIESIYEFTELSLEPETND